MPGRKAATLIIKVYIQASVVVASSLLDASTPCMFRYIDDDIAEGVLNILVLGHLVLPILRLLMQSSEPVGPRLQVRLPYFLEGIPALVRVFRPQLAHNNSSIR